MREADKEIGFYPHRGGYMGLHYHQTPKGSQVQERIFYELSSGGFAIVSDVPCDENNASLLAIALMLGKVSNHGSGVLGANAEPNGVHRIETLTEPVLER